jgi:DNA invertase Pin-like site-specific DNA recombinase
MSQVERRSLWKTPTWKKEQISWNGAISMATESPILAAQYLRMSTEHQQYSLEYQAFIISSYAARNNFVIVRSYTDAAKSGLVLKDRTGLCELLRDVVSGDHPFKVVLVYDISRWGRFQDADEGAHYEFICRQAGVQIHYCAETFANDGTMPSAIMKALKRVMAAEYSRELSERTTLAIARLVRDGFWGGASPGYGLRRMLVGQNGKRKQLLNVGERKALHDEHTILVPGPPDEIKVIKEIFRLYTEDKRSMSYIARRLNEAGILHGAVCWNYHAIRKILFSEKYSGSLVWRRYTQKLRSATHTRREPEHEGYLPQLGRGSQRPNERDGQNSARRRRLFRFVGNGRCRQPQEGRSPLRRGRDGRR